jgi:hypothetical protein
MFRPSLATAALPYSSWAGFVVCLTLLPNVIAAAVQIRHWEHAPYELSIHIAIEAPGQLREKLQIELPRYIQQRIDTSVGPIWSSAIQLASPPLRAEMLSDLATVPLDHVVTDPAAVDKLQLLTIQATGDGFHLAAREYDGYVGRWGEVVNDSCRQYAAVNERAFLLLWETFAPLARLRLDPENDDLVLLDLRGTKVFAKDKSASPVKRGDVFLPVLRRTTREGELIENGIQPVPWTYVTTDGTQGETILGNVYSGTKRPLGVRRRGRVEQVAIALRGKPVVANLHLHSRNDAATPLVGYEIYTQDAGSDELGLAGLTDRDGSLPIAPGNSRVQLVFVKNGGQLLARLPVVPGIDHHLDVPLPDDNPRLKAEATLTALRENLIDLVARRNILIARIHKQIDNDKLDDANRLLDQLEELPGRVQFNRELDLKEQLHRSSDPQIQLPIDKLFSETRAVLGHFLDAREVSQLRDKLTAARSTSQQGLPQPNQGEGQ